MDVLRTSPIYYPHTSGPARQIRHVSKRLLEQDIRSHLFTSNFLARQAPPHERADGFAVRRLHAGLGVMGYRFTRDLHLLRDAPADLVHAHMYRNALTPVAARTARERGVPYVLQPHGTLRMYRHILPRPMWLPYVAYDRWRAAEEVRAADAVVVATEQEKGEAIAFGLAAERVHVIPVGLDPWPFEQRIPPGGDPSRLTVLFVGRICADRRVEQVIDGFALAYKSTKLDRPVHLRLVGPAEGRARLRGPGRYMRSLRRRAAAHGLKDVIEFVGPRYGDALRAEYQRADVFAYCSDYENFGQPVLEAAAAGCPVLATPTGVARDIVRDGETGYLVAHRNAGALADRLQTLWRTPEQLAAMGRAMHAHVHAYYRWDAIVQQYATLYRQLTSGSAV